MGLRQERVEFCQLKTELFHWFLHEYAPSKLPDRYELAEDEGTVHSPRAVRTGDGKRSFLDGVHRKNSFHHVGKAVDVLIYINGTYEDTGAHPVWKELDVKARSLNPMFGFGIAFHDANHLSLGESKGA